MTGKRILKWSMWLVAGCIALAVLLCLYILLVNRHDQPPSQAVLRFETLMRDLPPVADKDNGYVYFVGMSAPLNVDPRDAGMVRIAWAKQWMEYTEKSADHFPGKSLDIDAGRSVAIKALAEQCKNPGLDCASALDAGGPLIAQWLASEKVLAERYNTLLTYPEWRETLPFDERLPAMPYVSVLEGQKVHLLTAWERAGRGDTAGVKALLEKDMQFWRRNLLANDSLIAQMISSAAIRRNLAWGNLILRRLPADKVLSAIPGQWRDPVSAQERAMVRSLAGEWRESANQLKKMSGANGGVDLRAGENPIVRAIRHCITSSTFQLQDTSNQYADLMAFTAETYAVGYEQIPAAMGAVHARVGALQEGSHGMLGYNILGNILVRVGVSDMTRYAVRIPDLEGIRRATLLMAELRSHGVYAADIEAHLAAAHVGNPYDGKPFGWDGAAKAIVVTGLEEGKWARTTIPY